MTVRDLIEKVVNDLNNVEIPLCLIFKIGIPIAQSIENLKLVLDAWNNQNEKSDTQKSTKEDAK